MSRALAWGVGLLPQRLRVRVFGETALYTLSSGAVSALAIVPKTILASSLTVREFGAFSVGTTILAYASMFFEFGLFLPAARRSALSDTAERRRLTGSALTLYVPVGLAMVIFLVLLSFRVDAWFHVQLASGLRAAAPLAFFIPFSTYVGLQLSQGRGRLHIYSIASLLAQIAFVAGLAGLYLVTKRLTVLDALVVYSAGQTVGAVVMAVWLHPTFSGVRSRIRLLVADAREYGFRVYVGRVLSIGTYNMDVLMLAALTNARSVAVYALAGSISTVAGIPIVGLSNALFSDMARISSLERRWLLISWAVGGAGIVVAWLATVIAVGTIFPSSYHEARLLVIPLGVAGGIRGVTKMYNAFLATHGLGRELQNANLILAASNVVLNFALIPPFGAMGAAFASLLALVANLVAHQRGYRNYRRRVTAEIIDGRC